MSFPTQTVQLAAGVVTALPDQAVPVSSQFGYNLEFNVPVKQLQIEWTIATSTSCNIQLYQTLDFAFDTYVANVASGVGQNISYEAIAASTTDYQLKYNNYDAVNVQNVTSVSVLGVPDS